MKIQLSFIILISTVSFLAQPAWSMEERGGLEGKENHGEKRKHQAT